jgi:nucleoside-diphosphate-sugar epimerase
MRILVIGGTNFIGPPVIIGLHRQGHELTVYHRGLHEPELPSDVRHVHSPDAGIPVLSFPLGLSGLKPDIVLHMFPVGEADSTAAVAHFKGVARRIVAVSSGDVYRAYGRILGTEPGPPEPVPLDEDAPLRSTLFSYRHTAAGPSDWAYHYEKILAERTLRTGPLPATVLRLPAVYGPGDLYHRFRPYIGRMRDKRPAILLQSTQASWRWSHGYVENVAHAIVCAVLDDRAVDKVYNVSEEQVPTTAERIRRIGDLLGWTGSIVPVEQEHLPQHLRSPIQPGQDLVMDSGKIRVELGYREPIPVEEGLRRTIEWELSRQLEAGDPGPTEYAAEDLAIQRLGM